MNQHQQLIELSKKMIDYSESALRRYEFSKQEGTRGDFHTEVKPFADEVKETAILWKEAATNWVIEHKPKNLHSNQIETAADYIEVISVQAFFPETSRKRFLDQIQSVEFILHSLILAVEKVTKIK
ncbi:YppE family protein [Bacillus sp. JJ1122]|uniref:YppE family protein n=1 Tax=Bacillus sp. JJ1122 TaxID=3122951 RepID=UPI00300033C1